MAEQMLADVEYRSIEGFPLYRVGSDGTVWSRQGRGVGALKGNWSKLKGWINEHGYRCVGLHADGAPTKFLVHRLVLLAFVGPCPEGMEACHSPDPTPTNCNLSNLRWDTRAGNMADMVQHGHSSAGEKNPLAELTNQQVIEMRTEYAAGATISDLAHAHDVSRGTVRLVLRGETWAHVSGPIATGKNLRRRVLSDDDVREIRRIYRKGKGSAIARQYGVSPQMVWDIANDRRYVSIAS